MSEEYIKDAKIVDRTDEEKHLEIIMSIIKTKQELESANKNFEYAEDDLIDYYSYQIKAHQAKLDYLVKKAKKAGLVLDMIIELEIRLYKVV